MTTSAHELQRVAQRMTMSDDGWQWMIASYNEWLRVATSDTTVYNKWQQVTRSGTTKNEWSQWEICNV